MAWGTTDKMVFGYANVVPYTTSVNSTASSDKSNPQLLKFQDPGRAYKFTDNDGDFDITLSLSGTFAVAAVGLIRHNLTSVFGSNLELTAKVGSSTIGSGKLPLGDLDRMFLDSDAPVSTGSSVTFQFRGGSGSSNVAYIGAVWAGYYYELDQNPKDRELSISRSPALVFDKAMGGARHVTYLGDVDERFLKFKTERARIADVTFVEKSLARAQQRGDVLGCIAPWETDSPDHMAHFFGYLTSSSVYPRRSNTGDLRYDLEVEMTGV